MWLRNLIIFILLSVFVIAGELPDDFDATNADQINSLTPEQLSENPIIAKDAISDGVISPGDAAYDNTMSNVLDGKNDFNDLYSNLDDAGKKDMRKNLIEKASSPEQRSKLLDQTMGENPKISSEQFKEIFNDAPDSLRQGFLSDFSGKSNVPLTVSSGAKITDFDPSSGSFTTDSVSTNLKEFENFDGSLTLNDDGTLTINNAIVGGEISNSIEGISMTGGTIDGMNILEGSQIKISDASISGTFKSFSGVGFSSNTVAEFDKVNNILNTKDAVVDVFDSDLTVEGTNILLPDQTRLVDGVFSKEGYLGNFVTKHNSLISTVTPTKLFYEDVNILEHGIAETPHKLLVKAHDNEIIVSGKARVTQGVFGHVKGQDESIYMEGNVESYLHGKTYSSYHPETVIEVNAFEKGHNVLVENVKATGEYASVSSNGRKISFGDEGATVHGSAGVGDDVDVSIAYKKDYDGNVKNKYIGINGYNSNIITSEQEVMAQLLSYESQTENSIFAKSDLKNIFDDNMKSGNYKAVARFSDNGYFSEFRQGFYTNDEIKEAVKDLDVTEKQFKLTRQNQGLYLTERDNALLNSHIKQQSEFNELIRKKNYEEAFKIEGNNPDLYGVKNLYDEMDENFNSLSFKQKSETALRMSQLATERLSDLKDLEIQDRLIQHHIDNDKGFGKDVYSHIKVKSDAVKDFMGKRKELFESYEKVYGSEVALKKVNQDYDDALKLSLQNSRTNNPITDSLISKEIELVDHRRAKSDLVRNILGPSQQGLYDAYLAKTQHLASFTEYDNPLETVFDQINERQITHNGELLNQLDYEDNLRNSILDDQQRLGDFRKFKQHIFENLDESEVSSVKQAVESYARKNNPDIDTLPSEKQQLLFEETAKSLNPEIKYQYDIESGLDRETALLSLRDSASLSYQNSVIEDVRATAAQKELGYTKALIVENSNPEIRKIYDQYGVNMENLPQLQTVNDRKLADLHLQLTQTYDQNERTALAKLQDEALLQQQKYKDDSAKFEKLAKNQGEEYKQYSDELNKLKSDETLMQVSRISEGTAKVALDFAVGAGVEGAVVKGLTTGARLIGSASKVSGLTDKFVKVASSTRKIAKLGTSQKVMQATKKVSTNAKSSNLVGCVVCDVLEPNLNRVGQEVSTHVKSQFDNAVLKQSPTSRLDRVSNEFHDDLDNVNRLMARESRTPQDYQIMRSINKEMLEVAKHADDTTSRQIISEVLDRNKVLKEELEIQGHLTPSGKPDASHFLNNKEIYDDLITNLPEPQRKVIDQAAKNIDSTGFGTFRRGQEFVPKPKEFEDAHKLAEVRKVTDAEPTDVMEFFADRFNKDQKYTTDFMHESIKAHPELLKSFSKFGDNVDEVTTQKVFRIASDPAFLVKAKKEMVEAEYKLFEKAFESRLGENVLARSEDFGEMFVQRITQSNSKWGKSSGPFHKALKSKYGIHVDVGPGGVKHLDNLPLSKKALVTQALKEINLKVRNYPSKDLFSVDELVAFMP